jgi:hypothetical protein
MSQLEAATKAIALPLIPGETSTLDADQLLTLAEWITMKVIVSEHDEPRMAVTPDHDRLVFKETRGIPRYFRIHIGHNESGWRVGFLRRTMTLSRTPAPIPPLGPLTRNVQTVTFIIGALLVYVSACRTDGFDLDDIVVHQDWGYRLWPKEDRDVAWPPARALSKRDLSVLANTLDHVVNQPNYRWAGYLPGQEPDEHGD